MEHELTSNEAREKTAKFIASLRTVYVATNGANGHPNVRAMNIYKSEGTSCLWFATELESSKMIELIKSNKAAVYGCASDGEEFRLWGSMTILEDKESMKQVWCDDLERRFGSIASHDVRVLRFDAISGSYAKGDDYGTF